MSGLRCPVCLEAFRDPHVLAPCGHTFCRGCIDTLRPCAPATRTPVNPRRRYNPGGLFPRPATTGLDPWDPEFDAAQQRQDREERRLGQRLHPEAKRCPVCREVFEPREAHPNFALRLLLEDIRIGAVTPAEGSLGGLPPDGSASARSSLSAIVQDVDGVLTGGGTARSSSSAKRRSRRQPDVAVSALCGMGVPWGLARLIHAEDQQVAMRLFVLDNSGSTMEMDGAYLDRPSNPGDPWSRVSCTRWEEIQRMAMHQAEWNATVGTPCEFFLLNSLSKQEEGLRPGIDYVRVDPSQGDQAEQLKSLRAMMSMRPRGTTPLSMRLAEIYKRIQKEQEDLLRANQRVFIVIVTDGLPTSEYSGRSTKVDRSTFVDMLRRLCTDLPVNIVVRLTTGEHDVLDFFAQVDKEPELNLEVLDDIESEAQEVCRQGNVWLTYSPLIQMIREGGTFVKLFDVIDERKLTGMEALLLAHLLLQREGDPPPPLEPKLFCRFVEERVGRSQLVYEPLLRQMAPVVEVANLRWHLMPLASKLPFMSSPLRPQVRVAWWRRPFVACFGKRWAADKRFAAAHHARADPGHLKEGILDTVTRDIANEAETVANLEDIHILPETISRPDAEESELKADDEAAIRRAREQSWQDLSPMMEHELCSVII